MDSTEKVRAIIRAAMIWARLHSYQPIDNYISDSEAAITQLLDKPRCTVAGKSIEFAHTAANGAKHLFIDGYHNPDICPECIKPGVLLQAAQEGTQASE
jgi:hypothetical protein